MLYAPPTSIPFIIADLLQICVLLIIAEVIVSWAINFGTVSPYRPWVRTLRQITDPMLEPFRRVVPPGKLGGIDVSPFLAVIVIQIVQGFLTHVGR